MQLELDVKEEITKNSVPAFILCKEMDLSSVKDVRICKPISSPPFSHDVHV